MAGLANIPGTLLHDVLTAQPQQKEMPSLPTIHEQCAERKCTLCNLVFAQYVSCGKDERERIANATKGQNNRLWQDQRRIRITSSEASEVPKKVHPKNWVVRKLNASFTGNAATKHGQTSEPLARQWFEETTGLSVETTGLVVDEEDNWLGASLDGVVNADTILEIKCPTEKNLRHTMAAW